MGRGNNDARCFRRPKVKRPVAVRAGWLGRWGFSKETWPPELPSDLEDSDALVAGGAKEFVLSTDSRGSASASGRRCLHGSGCSFWSS